MGIEECVFQHKQILLQNKTLKDTVQPTQHWTLKQAVRKGGCLCCAPEGDGEEEEEEAEQQMKQLREQDMKGKPKKGKQTNTFNGVVTSSSKRHRPMYVDGKNTFAFDP